MITKFGLETTTRPVAKGYLTPFNAWRPKRVPPPFNVKGGKLGLRQFGETAFEDTRKKFLSAWPIPEPKDYLRL